MKRDFIMSSNDYINKPTPNCMIKSIKRLQLKLQREENIKFGRKSRVVSYVYAAKVYNDLMSNHLEEVLK